MTASLAGIRVVVTRAADDAHDFAAAFTAAGARVALLPLLEIVPPAAPAGREQATQDLGHFDWIALTSAHAVRVVAARLKGASRPPRIAVVGPATALACAMAGLEVDLAAGIGGNPATAEGLLARLLEAMVPADQGRGVRVLLPQAADALPTLGDGLRAAGCEVTSIVAYDKRQPAAAAAQAQALFAESALGWVTFSSPRIVRHFAALFGETWTARRGTLAAAAIGPRTSAALRDAGVEPAAEASSPTAASLVAAVAAAVEVRPYQPI